MSATAQIFAKTQALTKLTPAQRTAIVLRVNRNTRVDEPTQADKDRSNAIVGKSFHGREI